jgi:DnaK suppressor protein
LFLLSPAFSFVQGKEPLMQDVNVQIDKIAARKKLNETIEKYTQMIMNERNKVEALGHEPRQADALDASQTTTDMQVSTSLSLHYENHIKLCREALKRLDNDEYGDCISCYDEIEVDRLVKIPHLAYCSSCADVEEQKARRA